MDTQPMEPIGEPPLDKSKDSAFDRMATDRGGGGVGRGPGPEPLDSPLRKGAVEEVLDPRMREVLAAAQDSGLVEVPSSFAQRPFWEAPEWPRNGREVGSWASGVLATLEPESAGGFDTLHVQMRKDHVDGAVTALVDAGARVVRRSRSGGFVTLEVSRNPG